MHDVISTFVLSGSVMLSRCDGIFPLGHVDVEFHNFKLGCLCVIITLLCVCMYMHVGGVC